MVYDMVLTLQHGRTLWVVSRFHGAFGEQFAVVRRSTRGTPQVRLWIVASHRWSKWRKLYPSEPLRLATVSDETKFKPDFGPAWEC